MKNSMSESKGASIAGNMRECMEGYADEYDQEYEASSDLYARRSLSRDGVDVLVQ